MIWVIIVFNVLICKIFTWASWVCTPHSLLMSHSIWESDNFMAKIPKTNKCFLQWLNLELLISRLLSWTSIVLLANLTGIVFLYYHFKSGFLFYYRKWLNKPTFRISPHPLNPILKNKPPLRNKPPGWLFKSSIIFISVDRDWDSVTWF